MKKRMLDVLTGDRGGLDGRKVTPFQQWETVLQTCK